ncbi:MAG: hypothetical protein KH436_08240 [Firmicutes bacterium]|nr:hypothetical protein [Bacillota bacterium]
MQKIDLKLLKTALKSIAFIVGATLFLMILHFTKAFTVAPSSWRFLLLLVGFFVVHWIALLAIVTYQSDKMESSPKGKTVMWAFAIAASFFIFLVVTILMYVFSSDPDFFKIDAGNFFVGFAIIVGITALAYIIDYIVRISIRTVKYGGEMPAPAPGEEAAAETAYADAAGGDATKGMSYQAAGAAVQEPGEPSVYFPDLLAIDKMYADRPYKAPEQDAKMTLRKLVDGFNRYLETYDMFYSIDTIRSFLAGLACSRFLILEGLSGTGKTSLPKYFAEYTHSNVCFTSVQASWKDRSDILGYYNDFAGKFKETPFLRALYRANYEYETINMMVLDEMNLSRVEYYFADFLSILEMDGKQWNIDLMAASTQGELPAKLQDCAIVIPYNTWFIGTANKDDSTFTITDKVYDRAVVIDFSERKEAVTVTKKEPQIRLNKETLVSLFEDAVRNSPMAKRDYDKFAALSSFMLDTFDVSFGNRIMNQIQVFVPVYIACGGTADKALDLMFARKVLRKLEGRFEENLKQNLTRLEKYVTAEYGKDAFSYTLAAIAKMKRRLI